MVRFTLTTEYLSVCPTTKNTDGQLSEMIPALRTVGNVKRLSRTVLGVLMAMTLSVPVGATLGLASSGASTPRPCGVNSLEPTGRRSSGAAGTTYVTLRFENIVKGTTTSTGWCTLSGTPTTHFGNFVPSGGVVVFRAVGPAATKLTFADRGKTITLKPGDIASVTVGISTAGNYVPSRCHKANVSLVQLVFSSGAAVNFTLHTTQVCTKIVSTTTSGVVLGTRYP